MGRQGARKRRNRVSITQPFMEEPIQGPEPCSYDGVLFISKQEVLCVLVTPVVESGVKCMGTIYWTRYACWYPKFDLEGKAVCVQMRLHL